MSLNILLDQNYQFLAKPLENIKNIFSQSTNSIHKARNELKTTHLVDTDLVIKSFKIPHLFNKIVYTFFRKSKAYRSFHNAQKLILKGINTPQPIALLEFYKANLLNESYYVAEEFKYDFTIREALLHQVEDTQNIFKAFAEFTHKVHKADIWHKDYSPGNILIKKEGDNYIFSIVDINRMDFIRISEYDGLENFNKLWADEADLEIMAKVYAKLEGIDEKKAIQLIIKHDKINKRIKNFKKKLKFKK
ncbi:MAG: hypothetical protein GQ570_14370 [Helicobacteraceae bacterium]|nr:hypothetical protein [Helicobacteraceae bacterium]